MHADSNRQTNRSLLRPFDTRLFFLAIFLAVLCQLCLPVFSGVGVCGPSTAAASLPAHTGEIPVPEHLLWPHEKSDLPPDPDLIFGRLDNGFRYVLMNNAQPQKRVSIHLDVLAGSLNEEENQRGAAHFLEHLMFCGTTHFAPGELVEYFQGIGMQFGPDANARTGFSETSYDILLPSGDFLQIDKALTVMKDFARGALLLPEEIERERRVVLAEMHTRDSASFRTFEADLGFEFPHARISGRLPIGKEAVLNAMDRTILKSFYDAWYTPDRMVLVVVGDFDASATLALVRERFTALTRGPGRSEEPDFGEINHRGNKAFYHYENEAGNTTVSIETIKKTDPEPDSSSAEKKRLLQDMANRILRYRLNDALKHPAAPITSANIHSGRFLRRVEFSQISAESNPENWRKALFLVEQTLRQARVHGFTGAECGRVKKEVLAELEKNASAATTRDSGHLARKIMSRVNQDRVMMSPGQRLSLFSPFIESVAPEDLRQAFARAWDDSHRLVLVTGNAALGKSPEDAILSAFNESKTREVLPPEEKAAAPFPYLDLPEHPGRIAGRIFSADLGIVQIDFENNLRLNLKKTDFKANTINIAVRFGAGRSSMPLDKPGLADLSKDVVNEGGLGKLTREDLDRALSGKTTRVSFGVREDAFLFTAETTPDEIGLAFQLLYSHLVDPGFREDAFLLALKRFNQEYLTMPHTVEGAMMLQGKRFLAGEDPRFGLPAWDRFNRLTLADVISWLSPVFSTSPIEVSVVGDFSENRVIRHVAETLGALDKRTPPATVPDDAAPRFPEAKTLTVGIESKVPQAMVVIAYPTSDIWDIHQTRRLSVLSQVLSDRLRINIREKIGAAYSPYAYNNPSRAYPGYGVLYAYIETKPSLTSEVISAVKNLSTDLCQAGASPEELRLALDPILTGIRDMKEKNQYWLGTVLSGSKDHPRQLDWSRTIETDYSSITAEEISRLARKILDPEHMAVIVISSRE